MEGYQLTSQQLGLLLVLAVWDIAWKGFALWRAAKNNHKAWFVALMIFNSIGILPIIYLLLNRDRNKKS